MLAILTLLVCAFVLTAIQFYYLNNSQSRAIRESVPALAESQRLESLMAELLLMQSRIRSATSVTDTGEITDQLESLNNRIVNSRTSIATSNTSRALSAINEQLNRANLAFYPWLSFKLSLNKNIAQLSEIRDELTALSEQFLELTEPELLETESALYEKLQQGALSSSDVSRQANNGIMGDEISRLLTKQNVLTEITFRYLAVIEESIQLSRNTEGGAAEQLVSLINLNLKTSTQRLTSLEDSDFRQELALMIRQLRQLIVAPDGINQLLVTGAGYQEQIEIAQNEQAGIVIILSAKIDDIVNDTRNQIVETSAIFTRALSLTSLFLSAIGLLILGIVLLVTYLVIEKQINRRISLLTEAVLDIARGDTARIVSIDGDDEIGKMANSLSVFKDTALALRSSNAELEQFAYAAAHDLRSPLIAIENLATWTIEDAADSLPEGCLNNLELIVKRAKRLSVLQNDLLEYSRVGHAQNPLGQIALDVLIEDIAELFGDQEQFPVLFSGHTELVRTYVAPLRQILINLINNSKKHHDRDSGVINVLAQLEGPVLLITVIDDGPGIALEYQNRIFDLFTTLSAQDDVEGSGLGLALVNKLLHKHQGKIKLHSNPKHKRGARFVIEWPVF